MTSQNDIRKFLAYGVMPVLSGIGFYGSFYLSIENGLWDHLIKAVNGAEIGGTKLKVQRFTGIRPIDDYLAFYVAYFLPRAFPTMALQNRHFVTQYTALWPLVQLKGSPLISLLTGFGVQTLGAGAVIPLFCAYNLLTDRPNSPTTPWSAIGVIGPVLLGQYTKASSKQFWLAIWQLYFLVSEPLAAILPPTPATTVYTFAERLSTISHIAIVMFVSLSKLTPVHVYDNIKFVDMFWPRLNLKQSGDMMEARLSFMQWDQLFTNIGILVWAAASYVFAVPGITTSEVLSFVATLLVRACLTGPVGAVAWALRKKDALSVAAK